MRPNVFILSICSLYIHMSKTGSPVMPNYFTMSISVLHRHMWRTGSEMVFNVFAWFICGQHSRLCGTYFCAMLQCSQDLRHDPEQTSGQDNLLCWSENVHRMCNLWGSTLMTVVLPSLAQTGV